MLWMSPSLLILYGLSVSFAYDWVSFLNLPESHLPFYFTNNENIKHLCIKDQQCPYKDHITSGKCWGYEPDCKESSRYVTPDCSGDSKYWAKDKEEQVENFWKHADFGMLLERRNELTTYCQPAAEKDSSLKCVENLRYCRATDIYLDFSSEKITKGLSRDRFREDILEPGSIGGHCKMNQAGLQRQGNHKSPLQSWFAELRHYASLDFYPSQGENCDIVLDKPTYLIKLDAGVNMYHHFCDFVNLYASQHINNSFAADINIIMWDTTELPYGDFFSITWKAFTDHPVLPLSDFDGKRVCIRDAVFPLLPRMRYGLYYNMPLMPGCSGSGLIKAFSEHILHRLNIPQLGPQRDKIRVTLLARNTQYRNIMNQQELVNAMKSDGELEVKVVEYNRKMPFEDQLKHSHNSDIFIGMHGAGLTHLLFLPDWAVVMELYNCEDPGCYFDLSRLRGVKYMTWQRRDKLTQEDEGHHPTLGAHAKFTNYAFDVLEFMRLVYQAADYVRAHPVFIQARKVKHGQTGYSEEEEEEGKEEL